MGKRAGLAGPRSGLFYLVLRVADAYGATWVFLEHVPDVCANGPNLVVGALEEKGFDCRWQVCSDSSLGAPHERNRFFLLAKRRGGTATANVKLQSTAEVMQAARRWGWHSAKGHPARARCRLATAAECPDHKERNRAIGNALTPPQARAAFMYLLRGGPTRKNKRADLASTWEAAWPCFTWELRPAGARVATARYGCSRDGRVLLRPADDEPLNATPRPPVTLVPPTQPPTGRANTTPLIDRPMQLAHLSTPRASKPRSIKRSD